MKASNFMKKKGKAASGRTKKKGMGDAMMSWIGDKNQGAKTMAKAGGKDHGKR